jgi:mRNA interferase MazF
VRGEIWLVAFDPSVGTETNKTRPAVVVGRRALSERALERGRGVVPVVPVTSNVADVLDFQLLLPRDRTGLDADSKARAEQLRAVDVRRLVRRAGFVPADLMSDLDDRIRLWLDL